MSGFEESNEHINKCVNNEWERNLPETMKTIFELIKSEEWQWHKNAKCKYVTITIDMRDGGFVLTDRTMKRISLDALKWQIGEEK